MARPKPEIVDYLEEEFAALGEVDAARLFGGWQLRSAGRPFAVVIGGTLYFRVEGALREEMAAAGGRPFTYVKASGRVTIGRFMSAPEADMDDPEALVAWARKALGASHPAAVSRRRQTRSQAPG
jgi:DNA transformation protein and related proteins